MAVARKARRVSPLYVPVALRKVVEMQADLMHRTLTAETQLLLEEALLARGAIAPLREAASGGVDKQRQ